MTIFCPNVTLFGQSLVRLPVKKSDIIREKLVYNRTETIYAVVGAFCFMLVYNLTVHFSTV